MPSQRKRSSDQSDRISADAAAAAERNPLHCLMDDLDEGLRVSMKYQAASELTEFNNAKLHWLDWRNRFWSKHPTVGDAISDLRGPALQWCMRQPHWNQAWALDRGRRSMYRLSCTILPVGSLPL
jgi:hypothetical protein